jgi:hypothetical protein
MLTWQVSATNWNLIYVVNILYKITKNKPNRQHSGKKVQRATKSAVADLSCLDASVTCHLLERIMHIHYKQWRIEWTNYDVTCARSSNWVHNRRRQLSAINTVNCEAWSRGASSCEREHEYTLGPWTGSCRRRPQGATEDDRISQVHKRNQSWLERQSDS